MISIECHLMKNCREHGNITRASKKEAILIDKDSAIDMLLLYQYINDDGVKVDACKTIKDMTLKFDYVWNYDSYC